MAKGIKTGGGSRQGVPNRATADVRQAIALIAQRNVGNFETWLGKVALEDPGTEVSGPDGGPQIVEATWRLTE
jgi:hypothetical protein